LAGGEEGGERDLIVDASDLLHDAVAVRGPSIDAEKVKCVRVFSVFFIPIPQQHFQIAKLRDRAFERFQYRVGTVNVARPSSTSIPNLFARERL
jgi:hypothetical protein